MVRTFSFFTRCVKQLNVNIQTRKNSEGPGVQQLKMQKLALLHNLKLQCSLWLIVLHMNLHSCYFFICLTSCQVINSLQVEIFQLYICLHSTVPKGKQPPSVTMWFLPPRVSNPSPVSVFGDALHSHITSCLDYSILHLKPLKSILFFPTKVTFPRQLLSFYSFIKT